MTTTQRPALDSALRTIPFISVARAQPAPQLSAPLRRPPTPIVADSGLRADRALRGGPGALDFASCRRL
ncbi:hypothetical protein CERSUDRAFT_101697 [Gelatoporia subvermispora B]|uniref:Uncharacterized protein n=1 Tax=Ceriporiopsis subvermispora (strain B) TaxID=914234 RepID=M2P4X7_CERS8|nr:hypothetical protein CERSUDRAFT_101697 [Gelatoporia subvermispora B]